MRTVLCVLAALVSALPAFGEATQSDAQTLQAILSELRSMHSEIRAQAARTQTIEILLFELQTQQGAVNHATQRVDNAKESLAEVQEGLKRSSADLARAEDVLRAASSETDKATAEGELNRLKEGSNSFKRMEQDRLSDQQQADAQLRKAQITYDTIQDELNTVMKALQAEQPASR